MKMPPQIWIVTNNVAYMVIEQRKGGQSVVLASPEDAEELGQHRWILDGKGYAATADRIAAMTYMHAIVLPLQPNMVTDHIDGNRLNNQRSNLRLCAHAQNTWNRRPSKSCEIPFKGVSFRKEKTSKPYRASIRCGRKYELGSFSTAHEAARAYDRKAIELFGEFARTNESLGLLSPSSGRKGITVAA